MIQYDQDYVNVWREKAITEINQLEIGKTYYSNTEPKKFTVVEIISTREHYRRCNIESWKTKHDDLKRIVSRDPDRTFSMSDRNIGASYNPWLVFDNEEDRDEYDRNLLITYRHYDY